MGLNPHQPDEAGAPEPVAASNPTGAIKPPVQSNHRWERLSSRDQRIAAGNSSISLKPDSKDMSNSHEHSN